MSLQRLPDNVKKIPLFLFYFISEISEFPKIKKKFLSKIAKIFSFLKPLTEIKNQQGVYPNGLKLSMIGWNFPITRREAERGFSAFNSIKTYLRIYDKSIILLSLS